jgi:hypothetical protein
MKRALTASLAMASLLGAGFAAAQTETAAEDQPMSISGVETVCTGTTTDVRANPQWRDYGFHLEFAGKGGQYLGDEQVSVTGNGHSISVKCGGPWVLMKLPAGSYHVSAEVPEGGHRDFTMHVPGRMILHFPGGGGEVVPNGQVAIR